MLCLTWAYTCAMQLKLQSSSQKNKQQPDELDSIHVDYEVR